MGESNTKGGLPDTRAGARERRPRRLPRRFFARPVLVVARECIGKLLVHDSPEGLTIGAIVEAEAYRGPEDRAAHSWRSRRTPRTEPMYGSPGHAYVFLLYGMHWNFNVVTTAVGSPHAVLVRAVAPKDGLDLMARRRGVETRRVELTNGPGKLCQAFAISGAHTGADLCKRHASLFLADGSPPRRVRRSPRIGVDYAGVWAKRRWRFFDPDSPYVSR